MPYSAVGQHHRIIKNALRIRKVEEKFLELFSQGKLNGTVHTCVGQELSALAFAGQLEKRDFIFSNHRCHGHYLAFTGDTRGLMAELLGKETGTCAGIGSSQHLCLNNFYSNGVQGGIVPVAAGYALANKLNKNKSIGIVFIGDGTLGEGVFYETMNLISKWEIPLMVVCENNYYAQSTPQKVNLAGDILSRPQAFGIKTMHGDTWHSEDLFSQAIQAIDYVRSEGKPLFFLVDTYRLNAHSKGDDDRNPGEIASYAAMDFLNKFKNESPHYYEIYNKSIGEEIDNLVQSIFLDPELSFEKYYTEESVPPATEWINLEMVNKRQVELINEFFKQQIKEDERILFIGEDILSPYGGAFKVTKDLSDLVPDRVYSSSISEAAMVGIANGLALHGKKPWVEIMFGDFITLAFDQIVNHASKFHHMFNKKVNCPVVLRTPMGGHRGYGPTHSQTLDKFLIGIDNIKTVAINTFMDPGIIYSEISKENHPVIVIENKGDYGKKILTNTKKQFQYQRTNDPYPTIRIRPVASKANLTLVAYGGMADLVAACLEDIFKETDFKPELFVPTLISSLPVELIAQSVQTTKRLAVIEEGSAYGGIGAELITGIHNLSTITFQSIRISAYPIPIPSVKSLESKVLPDTARIIKDIKTAFSIL